METMHTEVDIILCCSQYSHPGLSVQDTSVFFVLFFKIKCGMHPIRMAL